MSHAAAKTGAGPMVTIAVEQHFPEDQRTIEDNLAYAILPFPLRAFVSLTRPAFVKDWMIRATEKSSRHMGRYDVSQALHQRPAA
jgi:hypothetical protein